MTPTLEGPEAIAVAHDARLPLPTFREVYDSQFAFIWRAVANRGVPASAIDDVVQEVFVVVHRKLTEFEGRSSLRTWLSGIVRRVIADHLKKRGNQAVAQEPIDDDVASHAEGPGHVLERNAALRLVDNLLATMSDVQREVFVLHELEQLTAREIAEVTQTNENTVQTRLRAARQIFQQGVGRHRATARREQ